MDIKKEIIIRSIIFRLMNSRTPNFFSLNIIQQKDEIFIHY
jgi:hypothetical protein